MVLGARKRKKRKSTTVYALFPVIFHTKKTKKERIYDGFAAASPSLIFSLVVMEKNQRLYIYNAECLSTATAGICNLVLFENIKNLVFVYVCFECE